MTESTKHEVIEKQHASLGETNQTAAFQKFVYASMDAYVNFVFMPFAYYRRVLDIAGSVALRRSATSRAREEDEEWIISEELESAQVEEPVQEGEHELVGVR